MAIASEFRAVFRCFHGCPGEYPLDDILYTCPMCGGLLEVYHDPAPLRRISADVWKQRFEARMARGPFPYFSGVWCHKEWVLPAVDDANIVSLGEGRNPLVPAPQLSRQFGVAQVWLKLCGNSATGSFKDLGMTVLVSQVNQMRANGTPIRAVACASTGDTSAALAAYCAAAGIPAVVLLPENKISAAQLLQPLAHGALTLALQTDFDGCMAVVKELTRRPEIYLANSMNSLRIEGQKTIAFEIAGQLGWQVPDWVAVPGGNLGNVSAIGKGFEMLHDLGLIDRLPRLICAQAERANPLYESYLRGFDAFEPKPAQPTLASAIQIGNPVSVHKAIRTLQRFNGAVEQASEEELAHAMAQADRAGLFVCPHTGVALAAVEKLARRGEIRPEDSVVVISTAHGLKFPETKQRYHSQELAGITPRLANQPISITASVDAVLQAVEERALMKK
ncbi:MAG: threonine synthase [candidate division KSB1 bacterium]|nr:threonine synthase [candidate division KSB1 bacterium]